MMPSTTQQIGYGVGLLALLYLVFLWRPKVGASLAVMLLGGVLIWQAQNKKGLFYRG